MHLSHVDDLVKLMIPLILKITLSIFAYETDDIAL